jgi:hypothetical protein
MPITPMHHPKWNADILWYSLLTMPAVVLLVNQGDALAMFDATALTVPVVDQEETENDSSQLPARPRSTRSRDSTHRRATLAADNGAEDGHHDVDVHAACKRERDDLQEDVRELKRKQLEQMCSRCSAM